MIGACGDDPNQQMALSHSPGQILTEAAASSAEAALAGMDLPTRVKQLHGPNTTGFGDIFRSADEGTIKGFEFRDGPRGVNLDPVKGGGLGYATSFPAASGRGASFDVDLEYRVGQAIGDELIAAGGTMILAPTVNILRHPAWARSQETYGEDSFHLGRMGSALTVGAQEYAPACVKHYAANNVDKNRDNVVAKMDEQTLREVYSRHFGMIIEDGGAACVMAAYNQVDYGQGPEKNTQSFHLLTEILRNQYGFLGMVLSDWWAMPGSQNADPSTYASTASAAIKAGMDMELPWKLHFSSLPAIAGIEGDVATSARRVLETKFRFNVATVGGTLGLKPPTSGFGSNYSITGNDAHIALAEEAAQKSMVLLKNDGVLPIKPEITKVAVVGAKVEWLTAGTQASGTINFASDARQGDLGSSRVNSDPAKSIGPCAGLTAAAPAGVTVTCADGDSEAQAAAAAADFVVFVGGLTPHDEGEDYTITPDESDRSQSLALDGKKGTAAQNALINAIAQANPGKPMVVVLEGGSTIDVSSFEANVGALVMAWYPGQSGGAALGKLLFGTANFSGKLPITWAPLDQYPPFSGNGGDPNTTLMDYYLGYRWFDTQGKTATYAYGHGLSYTTYEYSNLIVGCSGATPGAVVPIAVDVQNTGLVAGDEIVFVFLSFPNSPDARRKLAGYKELKGFTRVTLLPGEKKQVVVPVRVSDLWYWDTAAGAEALEKGEVAVLVGGGSSPDKLTQTGTLLLN
jgi:beta-glucosidase